MLRLFLVIVVLLVGYDAVVHQGAYSRNIWSNIVGLTNSAVGSAQGDRR